MRAAPTMAAMRPKMRDSGPVRKTLPCAAKLPGLRRRSCLAELRTIWASVGAEEDGLDADEEEAGGYAGDGEGVGEAEGLPVYDDEGD